MSIDELGIHLGGLYIRFYALALMTGMIAAATLTAYRAKRHGHDPNIVWDGLLWVIIAGIVGARLYQTSSVRRKADLTDPSVPAVRRQPVDFACLSGETGDAQWRPAAEESKERA